MSRSGDVEFRAAYGASVTLSITLMTPGASPTPVDVTGYTARLLLTQFDGSYFGAQRLALASGGGGIVVGTTNGLFTSTISASQTAALSAYFGVRPDCEPARWRLLVTPPASTEVEIAHGSCVLLETGSAIDPVSSLVQAETFSVTVSALATPGPAGATGPAGPIVPVTYVANGAMIANDKYEFDSHVSAGMYVKGLIPNATSAGDKLINANALTEALNAAALIGNVFVILPAFRVNIGTNRIVATGAQGIRIGCMGSAAFTPTTSYEGGGGIHYEGGGDASWDRQVSVTSASSVAIGTGVKSLTVTVQASGIVPSPGSPVLLTATAGAVGTMTGLVRSIDYAGTALTVQVTSVTGSGTGTAWTVATKIDDSILKIHSGAGLVVQNLTITWDNPAFTGWALDINGAVLASDQSQYIVDRCVFYFTGTPGDATYRPNGSAAGGLYMETGWGKVKGCSFFGMLRGCYLAGQWNSVDDTNQFIEVTDAAVESTGGGHDIVVNSEPADIVAGFSYAKGGIKSRGGRGNRFVWNVGDPSAEGPLIWMIDCSGCHATGNFAINGGAVGALKCAIKLEGCFSTIITGDHSLIEKLVDVSTGATSIGIHVLSSSLAPADLAVGSNFSFFEFSTHAGANEFGSAGETRIPAAHLTNGATCDFGMHFGPDNYAGVLANRILVAGIRAAALAWGSNNGQAIEYLNTAHGYGAGIGVFAVQNDGNAGLSVITRNAAAANGQDVQWLTNPLRGTVVARGMKVTTPQTLTLANGANNDINLKACSLWDITGPTGAFSIDSIVAEEDGSEKEIRSVVAQQWTVTDESAATATRRIRTGTAANLVMAAPPAGGHWKVTIRYNGTRQRWEV
jgi:hypothetical protein